jgi:methylmalonyl-CoA/ethylmalonyl-CoA epimerase
VSEVLTLHHVGYVVNEIAPSAESHCIRFGYQLVTEVIHDAQQTALVQFLRLPGDSSWLEFVAPDGPSSKLARSAAKGGSLHHLCFTCGCLEAEITRLRADGMLLLAEPVPAIALGGRRIAWLYGANSVLTELVERSGPGDRCEPGLLQP